MWSPREGTLAKGAAVRRCRRLVAIGSVGAAVGAAGLLAEPSLALPPGCSLSGGAVVCTYSSGSNPFTVPAGVSSVHVRAVGGRGGNGGAVGAVVSANLQVTAGSTLYAVVGGNGQGDGVPGANGGGRGGPGPPYFFVPGVGLDRRPGRRRGRRRLGRPYHPPGGPAAGRRRRRRRR